MARPLVLISHLFRLANVFIFLERSIHPPLVRDLDPIRGIGARSLTCGLHRPKRMATYGLDVECPYTFDGTHFAQWKIG